jgi:prevent-host-death family protein
MKASDIKPITYMKTHSAELVASVNDTRSPVIITQNGHARAVVMDVGSYQRQEDALAILKLVAQSEDEIRRGRARAHRHVMASTIRRLTR